MWKTKHNKNSVGARVFSGGGGGRAGTLRHQITLSPLRTPSSSSSSMFTSDIQNAKTLRRNSTTYSLPVGLRVGTDPQCSAAVSVFSDDSSASSRSRSPVGQGHSAPQEGDIEAALAATQTSNPKQVMEAGSNG